MEKLYTIHYELQTLIHMMEYQIKNNIQIDNIFIDEPEEELPAGQTIPDLFINILNIVNFIHLNKTHNLMVFKDIYVLCNEFLVLFNETQKLPIIYIEPKYAKYYDATCNDIPDLEFSDFFRYKLRKVDKLVLKEDYLFKSFTYYNKSTCGYCDYTMDELENLKLGEDDFIRSHCKCKDEYIETFNYDYISFYNLNKKIKNLMNILSLAFGEELFFKAIDNVKTIDNQNTENTYPFINTKAKQLFFKLHDVYKDIENIKTANYSFIYYKMKSNSLLTINGVDFIKYLSSLLIDIDRIDNRQYGSNKRDDFYEECKDSIFKT